MKKNIIVLLVLAAVLLMSSCGGAFGFSAGSDDDGLLSNIKNAVEGLSDTDVSEAPQESEMQEEPETDTEEDKVSYEESQAVKNEYADIVRGGTYYMEYKAYAMGFEMDCKQARKGGNTDTISDMDGFLTHSMTLDGYQYDIDDESEIYSKTEISEELMAMSGSYDYTELKYTGSGEDVIPEFSEIDPASYPYDEFSMSIISGDSEMTVVMRYYTKDGALYVISSDVGGMVSNMIIKSLSKDIPAGMLEVPAGYTEVDSIYG